MLSPRSAMLALQAGIPQSRAVFGHSRFRQSLGSHSNHGARGSTWACWRRGAEPRACCWCIMQC